MAEVDFGDSELFEQVDEPAPPVATHLRFPEDDDEEEQRQEEEEEEESQLRSRMEECDDSIERLAEENRVLRRRLKSLTRPSGITIGDANTDGPLLQILYANNTISKQCRQEIEDCICSVILRHRIPGHENNKSSIQIKPQNSAFALDEDPHKSTSGSVRKASEAFKVVGNVQYFSTFSVDKIGQPLVKEYLTDGWDIPTYQQVFNQVVGTDGQEIEMKDKRPKSMCFNCGCSGHQLRDCPKPKDMAAINERRKEFSQNNQGMLGNQRYHADQVEERFAKYKPGVMSEELMSALGIESNTLPPLIYRMRQLGYPPGWLKEAELENSGLALYDGNASNNGNATEGNNPSNISYDVSKLVDFPGFNIPASDKIKDEFQHYGSLPMQSNHMKHNYAAYLSNNFPGPGAPSFKRRNDMDSSPQQRKKSRSSPDHNSSRSSDMDIESDPGTPYQNNLPPDFHFRPPRAPGSPCFSSPPPLPRGTPPATPTPPPLPKGTPPPTPKNGSPALRGQRWVVTDETVEATDDELTLEELEEQQRLIWAALENADTTTNSDSETPAMGTPVPSSPSVSTPVQIDTESEEAEEAMDSTRPAETCSTSEIQRDQDVQEICSQIPGAVREDSPESPEPLAAQKDSPQSPGPVQSQDDNPQSPGPVKSLDDNPQSPGPIKSQEDNPQSPGPVQSQEENPQSPGPVQSQDDNPQSPGPIKSQDDTPQSPAPVESVEDSLKSPGPVKSQEDTPQSPTAVESMEDSPKSPCPSQSQKDNLQSPDPDSSNRLTGDCSSAKKLPVVPHRSKFAAGIVPFENTPEFTEVAQSTGTYLKIRGLLKSSPRNLAKKK